MKKIRVSKIILEHLSTSDLIELVNREELFLPSHFSRSLLIRELLELDIEIEHLPHHCLKLLHLFDGVDDLPLSYGKTEIQLLLRDPMWCFAFWDINEKDLEPIRTAYNERIHFFLRITSFNNEAEPITYEDIDVGEEEMSMYIHTSTIDEITQGSLCYRIKTKMDVLAKSNFIYFPRKNIKERLSIEKDKMDKIMRLSGLQHLRQLHYNKYPNLFD